MAKNSAIEWTEASWNPLAGCKEISPGCANCYAAVMAHRLAAMGQAKYQGTTRKLPNGKVVWTGKINTDEEALTIPLGWKKPRRVFVNSMSDLLHEDVPDSFIDSVFRVMINCPQHTFQILTKRAERMATYTSNRWGTFDGKTYSLMAHIWLGVSVEDQQRADERIPLLLQTPAVVRFLSCEPLLGPVELRFALSDSKARAVMGSDYAITWVIVGGEGHGARPCNLAWIRSIVQQCKAAGVPCFVKQLGSNPYDTTRKQGLAPGVASAQFNVRWELKDRKGGNIAEWPEDLRVREFPRVEVMT